jgi:hypothetical protein
MELAIAALLAIPLSTRKLSTLALFCSFCLFVPVYRYAAGLTNPIDIEKTVEYRIAKWFDFHSKGQRVFVPGSISMWMNNFTEVPQFAGCCDQGVPSFMHRVAVYTVYSGQNAGRDYVPISTMWLQAYGVHAIAVTGPGSTEMFHPYAHPGEFRGQLPELWSDGDNAIYEIPYLTSSLAHVINAGDIVRRTPAHGLDVGPLRPYVAAILSTEYPDASFAWNSASKAHIETSLHRDQVVSVQVTYNPGWRAVVNGAPKPITREALGLMIIRPDVEGPCVIDLVYESRWRNTLRIAAIGGCILSVALALRSRRTSTV